MDAMWQVSQGAGGPGSAGTGMIGGSGVSLGVLARRFDQLSDQMKEIDIKMDVLQSAQSVDVREDLDRHSGQLEDVLRRLVQLEVHKQQTEARLKALEYVFQGAPQADPAGASARAESPAVRKDGEESPDGVRHSRRLQSSAALSPYADQTKFEATVNDVKILMMQAEDLNKRLENDRSYQEHMRKKLEESLLSFDGLNTEVDRLRRTVLLFHEPNVGQTMAAEPPIKAAAQNRKANSPLARLPNMYKAVNSTGDGFDPTNAHVEKCFTLLAGLAVAIILTVMIVMYWPHKFTQNDQMVGITRSDYDEIMNTKGLVGRPECSCLNAFATRSDFISDVTYELDELCGVPGEQTVSNYNGFLQTLLMIPGDEADEPPVYACPRVDELNPDLNHSNVSQTLVPQSPDTECGAMQAVYRLVMLDTLNNACQRAHSVHNNSVHNFLHSLFVNDDLVPKEDMINMVEMSLLEKAHSSSLVFSAAAAGTDAATLAAATEETFMLHLRVAVGEIAIDDQVHLCNSIKTIISVGYPEDLPFIRPLRWCWTHSYWLAQCCGDASPTNGTQVCGEVFKLPCSAEMQVLGNRLNKSEYKTLNDGLMGGLLVGMSRSSQTVRRSAKKDPATQSTQDLRNSSGGRLRRLEGTVTVDAGYFWTFDADQVFESYYRACQPEVCVWEYEYDHMYGMVLVISGLIGGATSGIINLCGCCAFCTKKCTSQEPVTAIAA